MFPEDLFQFALEQLADDLAACAAPEPNPLGVDSFIARSMMQKSIRRGMTHPALRAAATLITTDPRVLWRRLIVTAMEDLGIGEVDLLARIIAASRDRRWRQSVGGDWRVVSALVQQACAGTRCQSANDLANVAENDPALDGFKASLCESGLGDLLAIMTDVARPIEQRGVAVLIAMGEDAGPTAPVHIRPDPGAVFAAFANAGRYGHVVGVYADAFKQTRLSLAPLSLCLWSESRLQALANSDDDIPPVTWIGDLPAFCLDQYTRGGLGAIRQHAFASRAWGQFAGRWGIPRSEWVKALGELVFRVEGAVVTNRRNWTTGQALYEKSGDLGCSMPRAAVREAKSLIIRELPLIDQQRRATSPTSPDANRLL